MWCYIPLISVLGKKRQSDLCGFKASLNCEESFCPVSPKNLEEKGVGWRGKR